MKKLTPAQVKASLRRQRFLESLSDRLEASTVSRCPPDRAHLLPQEERAKAGSRPRKKPDGPPKILPAFLRRPWTKYQTILKWKLLGWSLRRSWSSFLWLRLTILRIRVSCSSLKNFLKRKPAGCRTNSDSPKRSANISAASRSACGENISATNICSPTKASPGFTRSNISCEISRASTRRERLKAN